MNMASYVIATIKSWNINRVEKLAEAFPEHQITLVTEKEKLNYEWLESVNPAYIFFPHWSFKIPKKIYENFRCVVFHMTDLPFGRGGSPLQNLIERGIYHTMISAIEVTEELDAGRIYMKEPMDISTGSADEIFCSGAGIVFEKMIPQFFQNVPVPHKQQGKPVVFKRRTPQQSHIPEGLSARQLYDFIRMLDGEGYPPAFRAFDNGKVYFRDARLQGNVVFAQAEFREDR